MVSKLPSSTAGVDLNSYSQSFHTPPLDWREAVRAATARLHEGCLLDFSSKPTDEAQIRLTVSSDDLLAVTAGELPFASAWAAGRLKIEASVLDMIRLRSLL